ncbi:GNAT family N-acetyltransferase [Actinorugispora endophytica]|uniref:Acetyltransferase (GNAT) family protein n=1 Tax=Actinorugispora endophytica TaxID=1605990 RepID=A0A4R6VDH1_9ACTN|nr:GNAT family protein [Actinorugispora endophytica]TDQ55047.1 acetyltransferase (GNAT) family protein [Actinorugispora endophytica]
MSDSDIWLRGATAGIGPVRADLVEEYWRWEQEIPTIVGYNRQTPQPIEVSRKIYDTYDRTCDNQLKFTIYDVTCQSPLPVGLAQVYIDVMRRNGEYVVALTRESRSKGIGTEASRLVLDYAFHITNLRCVYLTVIEPNKGAITAYERAGFRRQGVRRNSNQWLGRTVNEVLMDAIPEDFEGPSLVKAQFDHLEG